MNIQQIRHSLKVKWLLYYRQHRPWLTKIRIWGTYEGQRRPSSSFILATLVSLEPQLIQMFPFLVDLNNNPDKIIAALGLNFNPETELKALTEAPAIAEINGKANNDWIAEKPIAEMHHNGNGGSPPMLPRQARDVRLPPPTQVNNLPSWVDDSCHGRR